MDIVIGTEMSLYPKVVNIMAGLIMIVKNMTDVLNTRQNKKYLWEIFIDFITWPTLC